MHRTPFQNSTDCAGRSYSIPTPPRNFTPGFNSQTENSKSTTATKNHHHTSTFRIVTLASIVALIMLAFSGVISAQDCPVTPCEEVHQTYVNLSQVPQCGQSTISLNGDLQNGQTDCRNGDINCHEFIVFRPSGSLTQQFTLKVGQGSGCNGELDASYGYINGECFTLSNGGSQTFITFTFPFSVDTMNLYFCLNSGAHVTICDLCSEPPPCTLNPVCTLSDINLSGCAASVPAPLTDPADVFSNTASCSGTTLSMTHQDVGDTQFCANGVNFVRTYSLNFLDSDGNIVLFRQCSQNIVVTPTLPQAVCQNHSVNLDNNGNATITPADVNNGSNLGCGGVLSVNPSSFTCANIGANNVTLTVTDECGNTSTCQAVVTVNANSPAADAGPASVEVCTDGNYQTTGSASNGTILWSHNGAGSFNGTEGNLNAVYTPHADDYLAGSVVLTLTVDGMCSDATDQITLNFVQCACQVVLTCDTDVLGGGVIEGCSVAAAPPMKAASSVFDTVSMSGVDCNILYEAVASPGGILCAGGLIQTYNYYGWHDADNDGVRDAEEQQYSCSESYTILDQTGPNITCPGDLILQCGDGSDYVAAIIAWIGTAMATDDCDTDVEITTDYDGFTVPEISYDRSTGHMVTFTATDDCGNMATCTAMIYMDDMEPPMLECPQDLTIDCESEADYVEMINIWKGQASAMDACGQPVEITTNYDNTIPMFGCENGMQITFTATDAGGNTATCTKTVYKPCFDMEAYVYIEGATVNPNGTNVHSLPMRTTLNNLRILPGQTLVDPFFGNKYSPPGQPYSAAPWNYYGTEGDQFDSEGDPMFGDAGYPSTVVDWVLVSLRDNPAGIGGPLCQAAALLHNDGRIQFVEDLACCEISEVENYYVTIEHRNHLIIMSESMHGFTNNKMIADFRTSQSYVDDPFEFGVFARQKEILPGAFAMFTANGNQLATLNADTDTNFDDRSFWEGQNGSLGVYRHGDYNLNGDTNFNDRLNWERNNGKFTSVPRN